MATYVVVLGLYLAGMFVVGFFGRKYSETTDGFLTSGKRGTLMLVTASFMASHFGAGFVVGGAEQGAKVGLGGIWYGIACSLSYVVFGAIMSKRLYREKYMTVSDLLSKRYGDNFTANGYAILNAIASVGIMAGQIMAGQRLLQALGMDGVTGAIVCTVVVILYSAMSGLWGVMMTDFIQMSIGGLGLIAAFVVIFPGGGWSQLQTALPSDFFEWIPSSWSTYEFLMILIPTTLYGFLSQPSYQRTIASKTEKVAVWSPFIAALFLVPFAFIPALVGMFGHFLYPDMAPGAVFFAVIVEKFHPIAGALMLAAVIAAIMSTADSQLLAVTANIVHDLYQKIINPKATDRQCTVISYLTTVIVGLLALYVALSFTTIISLLSFTYSILVAATLVPVLGGFFWKGATSKGAICAMVTGILVLFLGRYEILSIPYPSLVAGIPALVVFVIVSVMTAKKNSAESVKQ
jgi:SSS family solute:Na+ symporter